jgi:hypothetical protein
MTVSNAQIGVPNLNTTQNCGNACSGQCSNFYIKRHDTRPDFKVLVEDCNGPMDLTDENLVVEVSMWTDTKIKTAITTSSTYFRLADDVGFDQIMVNDIIVVDRVRLPEQMLVLGFDETNKLIEVQRGYHGTIASDYKKGQAIKIFRILNAAGSIESVYEDTLNLDGTTTEDQLSETYLVYRWQPSDTCVPGCFLLEFKLLQMTAPLTLAPQQMSLIPSLVPSFTPSSYTPDDFGCYSGAGVEWERRFPNSPGFTITIAESPTSELV